jgi:hypothetical protein
MAASLTPKALAQRDPAPVTLIEMLTACAKLLLTPCQVLAPRRAILHTYEACRVLPLGGTMSIFAAAHNVKADLPPLGAQSVPRIGYSR